MVKGKMRIFLEWGRGLGGEFGREQAQKGAPGARLQPKKTFLDGIYGIYRIRRRK
jgi:hypothetical protein